MGTADAEQRGERLQKVLARAGVASRRGAEDLISSGRVRVNGRPAKLGDRAAGSDEVTLDGRPLAAAGRLVTYLLNKPSGYVSTANDEFGRPTVLDLVPTAPGLHPVGRLDRDSEGLLLLTTDGELTLRLTHPRYGHEKEYRVWCQNGDLPASAVDRLRGGVMLEDGPAEPKSIVSAPGGAIMVLDEGRKRQVRRMFAAVGHEVNRLQRTRVAGLELGGVAVGEWRSLGPGDFEALGYNPADRR